MKQLDQIEQNYFAFTNIKLTKPSRKFVTLSMDGSTINNLQNAWIGKILNQDINRTNRGKKSGLTRQFMKTQTKISRVKFVKRSWSMSFLFTESLDA